MFDIKLLKTIINISTIIVIFILSLYHFVIFIGRRKQKDELYNLSFAIFGICYAFYIYVISIMPKNKYSLILIPFSCLIGGISISIYISMMINVNKKYYILFYISNFIILISFFYTLPTIIFGKDFYFLYIFRPTVISISIGMLLIFSNIIIIILKKKLWNSSFNLLVFISCVMIILNSVGMSVYKMLRIHFNNKIIFLLEDNYLISGVIVFLFAISLAIKFNQEHKELIDYKNNLEQKVDERTAELKLTNLQLAESNRQIEQEKTNRTNFFINLAHETKTPLTLVKNYLAKYIKLHGTNEEMNIVKKNINKLEHDICNYLDVEKIMLGQELYEHNEIIELNDFIRQKTDLFSATASMKGILPDYKKFREDVFLRIDSSALDKILNNLLTNAFKFSFEKSKIEIGCRVNRDNFVELFVKDYGPGIPQDQQERIFEPYYKLHDKDNTGVGMGLFIVKNIVDKLSGKIEVESCVNEGSTFRVLFKKYDLKQSDKVKNDYFIPGNVNADYNTKPFDDNYSDFENTILIVEDNIELLRYLQSEFVDDYNVFAAVDGQDALRKLKSMPGLPDLILSDIMMSKMDGVEFFKEINFDSKYQGIPFIFLTAKTGDKDKINCLESGAVDFISKPFNNVELKAKVRAIVENKKKLRKGNLSEFKNRLDSFLDTPYVDKQNMLSEDTRYKINNLSQQRKRILKLFITGLQYKEIGNKLEISESTVSKSMSDIFTIFEVNNKVDLLRKIYNFNDDIF